MGLQLSPSSGRACFEVATFTAESLLIDAGSVPQGCHRSPYAALCACLRTTHIEFLTPKMSGRALYDWLFFRFQPAAMEVLPRQNVRASLTVALIGKNVCGPIPTRFLHYGASDFHDTSRVAWLVVLAWECAAYSGWCGCLCDCNLYCVCILCHDERRPLCGCCTSRVSPQVLFELGTWC